MSGGPRPVRRRLVLVGAVVAVAAVAGIVSLAEWLRHPPPSGGPPTFEAAREELGDPRQGISCPEPAAEPAPEQSTVGQRPPEGAAASVTSNDLYNCPPAWDGRRVRYEGEAVAGVLPRDGGAWVQLNDDVYAGAHGPLPAHRDYRGGNAGVGVLVPHELAAAIESVAGPQQRGDLVEVTGTFHRVDPDTAEVAVIRADDGRVVRPGSPFVDVRLPDRQVAAAALGVLALALVAVERWRAWRRRQGR